MKKFYVLTLAVMLLIAAARLLPADAIYSRDPSFTCLTDVHSASSGNMGFLSSNITAGNKVFGFTHSDSAAGNVGLYDVATEGSTSNGFGESNVAAGTANTVMFPFPRKIVNGVYVSFSTATGDIVIYYE